jgi:hypothetical protein
MLEVAFRDRVDDICAEVMATVALIRGAEQTAPAARRRSGRQDA